MVNYQADPLDQIFRGYKIHYLSCTKDLISQCRFGLNEYGNFNKFEKNTILINICRIKVHLPELFKSELTIDPSWQYNERIVALTITPAYVLLRLGPISEDITFVIYPEDNHYEIEFEGLRFPGRKNIDEIVSFIKENKE